MKSKELVEKVFKNTNGVFPQETILTAVGAFMANLAQALGIDLPDTALPSPDKDPEQIRWATTMFYIGVISGYGEDIPEKKLMAAHLSLMFPWSRAIISRGLYGEGKVTKEGVPEAYYEGKA